MRRAKTQLIVSVLVLVLFTVRLIPDVYAEDSNSIRIAPEYERTMKRVLVTLDAAHPTLDLQEDLLEKLPKYSKIILLAPQDHYDGLSGTLKHKPYGNRVTVVPFKSEWVDDGSLEFIVQECDQLKGEHIKEHLPLQWGTLWAQDLFEVGWNDSCLTILTPALHMAYWFRNNLDKVNPVSDIDYLYSLTSQGIAVKRLPFVFSGGNMLVDSIDGKTIAICGGDILRHTKAVKDRFPHMVVPPEELPGLIRSYLGVQDVVIAGYNQPTLMFHLDQAMILLGSHSAGVLTVIGPFPEERRKRSLVDDVMRFTTSLKKRLIEQGYTIIPIETTADDVLNYRLPTNGIVYTNAETGELSVLYPVFSSRDGARYTEEEQHNMDSLTAAGLKVIPLFTENYKLRGGPHCMINVLE